MKCSVTINRNGVQSFYGEIVRETESGYFISFDDKYQVEEWFSKNSDRVTVTIL
jgi:hypothetical protein